MDNITNKALLIAVGIFITIAITSGIFLSINEIKNVYQRVYETETNISNKFTEYDAYDNAEKTGLDVLNAVNKYNGSHVRTVVNGRTVTDNPIKEDDYSKPFHSTINESSGVITITFTKKY